MAQEAVGSPQISPQGALLAIQATDERASRAETYTTGQGSPAGL